MEILIAIYVVSAVMVLLALHRSTRTGPVFTRGYKRINWDNVKVLAFAPLLNTLVALFIWIQSVEDTVKGKV